MDKEKEIEKMVEIARKYSENFANTPYYKGVYTDMEAVYETGYRKADEVRKEILREIDQLAAQCGIDEFRAVHLRKYAKQLGVEVDE